MSLCSISSFDYNRNYSFCSKGGLERDPTRKNRFNMSDTNETGFLNCAITQKKVKYENNLHKALFDYDQYEDNSKNKIDRTRFSYTKQLQTEHSRAETSNYIRNWDWNIEKGSQVLDLPNFANDFYNQPIDWSKKNIMAIALGGDLYSYDYDSENKAKLYSGSDITSVVWNSSSDRLFVGDLAFSRKLRADFLSNKVVKLTEMDYETRQPIYTRSIPVENRKFPMQSVDRSGYLVGINSSLYSVDTRSRSRNCLNTYDKVALSVSKMQDGHLTALGFDGHVILTDIRRPDVSLKEFPHKTSVKALKWHPNGKEILAAGGGIGDGKIRFFFCNGEPRKCASLRHSDAQICDIDWFKDQGIIASYGYGVQPVESELVFWDLYSQKINSIYPISKNKSARALSLISNPDKTVMAYATTEEMLCFSNLPEQKKQTVKKCATQRSKFTYYNIR